ncbi:MAG TPA: response regulator [Candidatus Limnocylindrales bacterium]
MILIVDDEPSALMLLGMVLQSANYVVRKATSGRAALRMLERDDCERCSLVICDIRMPELDGREVIAEMRANPRLASIPVIMCTSSSERETVVDIIGRGACDYIVKPFQAAMVLAKVRAVIGEEKPVIESPTLTVRRLRISLPEYPPLVTATVPAVERIADDLVSALQLRNSTNARAVAERVWEPASLLGAGRAVDAARCVIDAPDESDALRNANTLVAELREFLAALQRVAPAQRL